MPLMRTHSTHDDQPHWPWLYSDAHIMSGAESAGLAGRPGK